MQRIRLAIADDSHFIRKAIDRLFQGDSQIEIVGAATSGEELIENLSSWRPDIITLDLSMPGMGGMEALDRIMQIRPVPVIVLSTHSAKDAPLTIEALNRGAVDYIDKQQYSLMDFGALRAVLRDKILQVTKFPAHAYVEKPPLPIPEPIREPLARNGAFEAVVIGASTGGPPAIERILADIGFPLPVPVAVVQHMSMGFTKPFAERLNVVSPMHVQEAAHGDRFTVGNVYIAPSGSHLKFRRDDIGVFLVLDDDPQDTQHRPSVDVLFESAVDVFGGHTIAVLLTGMGKDGGLGMAELAGKGAYTLVQSEQSCVVFGMPRAALEYGAASEIIDLENIGSRLKELIVPSKHSRKNSRHSA